MHIVAWLAAIPVEAAVQDRDLQQSVRSCFSPGNTGDHLSPYFIRAVTGTTYFSMMKQTDASEGHSHPVGVAGSNHSLEAK